MLKLGCFVALILFIGIPVAASQFLPWWGTLLVVAGEAALLIFVVPKLIGKGVMSFATKMITAKSIVLRNAEVIVHEATEVPRPERVNNSIDDDGVEDPESSEIDDEPEEEDFDIARYVRIDCTITPRNLKQGLMDHWDPFDFQLCDFDKDVSLDLSGDDETDDEDEAMIELVEQVNPDTGEVFETEDKLQGPHRLRLTFACPSVLQGRVKLRYYFEGLGDISLP